MKFGMQYVELVENPPWRRHILDPENLDPKAVEAAERTLFHQRWPNANFLSTPEGTRKAEAAIRAFLEKAGAGN